MSQVADVIAGKSFTIVNGALVLASSACLAADAILVATTVLHVTHISQSPLTYRAEWDCNSAAT